MKRFTILFTLVLVFGFPLLVHSHCEIPCGIYGDHQRIEMIREHIATVKKSMNMIEQLSQENPVNYNQLVRWVDNKEVHAVKIQDIVFQYFMSQRIKPAEAGNQTAETKYTRELRLLHQLALEAMKSKQTVDLGQVQKMLGLTEAFVSSYFEKLEIQDKI